MRDPWGNELEGHRKQMAGTPLPMRGILEGIQCDQDYLRLLFGLQTGPSRQHICHYCDAIQWIDGRLPLGPGNSPEELYTVYGPQERVEPLDMVCYHVPVFGGFNPAPDPRIIGKEAWIAKHGESAICKIAGWAPERTRVEMFKS